MDGWVISSRPKRLVLFVLDAFHKALPSLQELSPYPQTPTKGYQGGQIGHHKTGTYGRMSYRSALVTIRRRAYGYGF
jgi:hypothetical protein